VLIDAVHVLIVATLAVAGLFAGLAVVRGREIERLRRRRASEAASARATGPRPGTNDLLAMADWMSIGLLRIDAGGVIVLANDAAHQFLGRRPGTLGGLTIIEAFVDHRIDELARDAVDRGAAQTELSFGGEPPLALMVHARRADREGSLWMLLEDVSELRRLQRIRTEFIDNLSHELRTPLTTVRLLTELLAGEQVRNELPPRVNDAMAKIDVETGHLVQMVNELLDLSRIEQGEAPLQPVDVDLGLVVESSLERLRTYAERQGIRLRADLPAAEIDRTVSGDEERLGQVLVNLVHNAIKFSAREGEVVVRVRAATSEMLLEVEDHGVGIPRADQDRIFERFYKVDRARQRGHGGTGLGLAIARHIVERHGGRITVNSAEGAGSQFVVALPRSTGRAPFAAVSPDC